MGIYRSLLKFVDFLLLSLLLKVGMGYFCMF